MKRRKNIRRFLWLLLFVFISLNVLAYIHAYKLTHFAAADVPKTDKKFTPSTVIKILFTGINVPRPQHRFLPQLSYKQIKIQSNVLLDAWLIEVENSRGTIILFHGYGGDKSTMLGKAEEFYQLGFSTLLVDMMGAGDSEGNITTIGFYEAQNVTDAYNFIHTNGEENIILYGTSMGAAALMKAMKDDSLKVKSIIIECPFSSMYKTVKSRFAIVNAPGFPMAALLTFWGGVQHGFNAFSHNPADYVQAIDVPVLYFYGALDDRVSMEETETIFNNLKGKKKLVVFPLAGHENYLIKYRDEWRTEVEEFLND